MRRPAFETAWIQEIEPSIGDDFDEFRRVLDALDHWPSALAAEQAQKPRALL
jgi:hypothetical protein